MSKSLQDPISVINSVGLKRQQALNDLGVFTIDDLLTYFPFRYQDLSESLPNLTQDGQKATFKGIVVTPAVLNRFGKKSRLAFKMAVGDEVINVAFFNQPWMQNNIKIDQEIAVFGTYDAVRQALAASRMIKATLDELEPIYPTSKAIKQQTIKQLVENAYAAYSDLIVNLVPDNLIKKYRLVNRKIQIHNLHFPKSDVEAMDARRSASFEEFFLFQMKLQIIKMADSKNLGQKIVFDSTKIEQMINDLPFNLTKAQEKVTTDILNDLKSPLHMNRLLQGDVGSGKTIVAAIAMYAEVLSGRQAALMAPTEILASQHAQNLANLFDQLKIPLRIELLTGSTSAIGRREILRSLADGQIDIIIGTHALIQKDIVFHHLGLAVIDEQHRFGVNQRAILRETGENPDILAMSATPIPRTLTITAYGEMQVSVIDQLPPNRKPIITKQFSHNQFDQLIDWLLRQLTEGAQAYVVTPLIEESEVLDVQNAESLYQQLQADLPDFKLALLHGRIKNDQKQQIMEDFKQNKIKLLVATSVIEVGVDVPNATIMIIVDADRFGLAQLHQLRGRVGRGDKQSYTMLVADPKTEYGKQRLQALVDSNDGFILAQKDLELRGPGDVLGVQQSGMPAFRVGDPVKDLKMMEVAQSEASKLISHNGWEEEAENRQLVSYLSQQMEKYRNFD